MRTYLPYALTIIAVLAAVVCTSAPTASADDSADEDAPNAEAAAPFSDQSVAPAKPAKTAKKLGKKWVVLHQPRKSGPKIGPIPDNSPLEVLNDFELVGPRPGDPFLFGNFKSRGEWGIVNGALKPVAGKHTACKLIRAEDFELEGVLNADGLGGWFFLLGWNGGDGYMVYNVNLKTSGSPWLVAEFRDGKGLEDTHREFYRFVWKGDQPLKMTVEGKVFNLIAGREIVAQDLPLPNYQGGDLIVGTYDTRYGPKPLSIESLRIRAK